MDSDAAPVPFLFDLLPVSNAMVLTLDVGRWKAGRDCPGGGL